MANERLIAENDIYALFGQNGIARLHVGDIDVLPRVDAVPLGAYEQCKWERDTAIEQLESYGVSLCEKAEVAKVVHGRWIVKGQDVFCSHCDEESGHNQWGASAFSNYCPNCGAKMDGGK